MTLPSEELQVIVYLLDLQYSLLLEELTEDHLVSDVRRETNDHLGYQLATPGTLRGHYWRQLEDGTHLGELCWQGKVILYLPTKL